MFCSWISIDDFGEIIFPILLAMKIISSHMVQTYWQIPYYCKENVVNLSVIFITACIPEPSLILFMYTCRQNIKTSAYLTVSGSWIKTSFTSYLGLIGFNSFILNLAVFFSKVWSFKLSNTFDFLFSILTSKDESVNTIESFTTEYGDSPGWIARLFLQKKRKEKRKRNYFQTFTVAVIVIDYFN